MDSFLYDNGLRHERVNGKIQVRENPYFGKFYAVFTLVFIFSQIESIHSVDTTAKLNVLKTFI